MSLARLRRDLGKVQEADAGQAIRYGVGVGAEGFVWSGRATVHSKQEWPDWYPPAEMLARKPELRQHMVQLQSGIGMKGLLSRQARSGWQERLPIDRPLSHGRVHRLTRHLGQGRCDSVRQKRQ
jgi:hypothetical protein